MKWFNCGRASSNGHVLEGVVALAENGAVCVKYKFKKFDGKSLGPGVFFYYAHDADVSSGWKRTAKDAIEEYEAEAEKAKKEEEKK